MPTFAETLVNQFGEPPYELTPEFLNKVYALYTKNEKEDPMSDDENLKQCELCHKDVLSTYRRSDIECCGNCAQIVTHVNQRPEAVVAYLKIAYGNKYFAKEKQQSNEDMHLIDQYEGLLKVVKEIQQILGADQFSKYGDLPAGVKVLKFGLEECEAKLIEINSAEKTVHAVTKVIHEEVADNVSQQIKMELRPVYPPNVVELKGLAEDVAQALIHFKYDMANKYSKHINSKVFALLSEIELAVNMLYIGIERIMEESNATLSD